MNLEDYIASGILESYALDQLNAEERKEVEVLLVKHPELKSELNSIEEGLEFLAMETAMELPEDLKDSIFSKIDDKAKVIPLTGKTKEASRVIRQLQPTSSPVWKYLVAASVATTIFSSYMAYDYQNKLKQAEKDNLEMQVSSKIVASELQLLNKRLDVLERNSEIFADLNFAQIKMQAVDTTANFAANVYWNSESQETYLNAGNLAALPQEKQYQLWAIVDGKPVDVGVFDPGSTNLLKMKNAAGASLFAVTIENRGGSLSPSLETMQVAGKV